MLIPWGGGDRAGDGVAVERPILLLLFQKIKKLKIKKIFFFLINYIYYFSKMYLLMWRRKFNMWLWKLKLRWKSNNIVASGKDKGERKLSRFLKVLFRCIFMHVMATRRQWLSTSWRDKNMGQAVKGPGRGGRGNWGIEELVFKEQRKWYIQ